jgi:MoxR-like ATPase
VPPTSSARFQGVDDVRSRLESAGYLGTDEIATIVHLADRLDKPLLVEGPAGVGKTALAKAVSSALGHALIRLQCYEGVDETKTLYEWNYKKQLLRIQASESASWDSLSEDIFSEDFLLERPVLKALRAPEPVVLLIDEVDKLDFEAEALLLEVLSDWQVSIPEMGTVAAHRHPFVVLTSNNERELSEALKRRCLYLHIGYPDEERELAIISNNVPELAVALAKKVARIVQTLRDINLKKAPSIAESIDWARTLVHLTAEEIDDDLLRRTLPVLLKYETDLTKAIDHLKVGPSGRS